MAIYFECDNDKALLEVLSIPTKKKHSFGKGNICNSLVNVTDSKGMVDEDPQTRQPKYITSLGKPIQNKFKIKIFIDSKRNNKVVMLCPKLEDWLYEVARKNNIDPLDFGLSKSPDDLHKMEFEKVKTKLSSLLSSLLAFPELQFLKSELT